MKRHPAATGVRSTCARDAANPALLEFWSTRDWADGLQVDALEDLDSLRVRTMNTVYEITIVSARAGEVVVQGGRYFRERTRVTVLGSSLGGGFLKLRGIYRGFSLELHVAGARIVTSTVQSVELVSHPGSVQ